MKSIIIYILTVTLIQTSVCLSQDGESNLRLTKILNEIRAAENAAGAGAKTRTAKYIKDLKALESTVSKSGDLDKVLQVTKERKAWEERKPTPMIDPKDESVILDLRKLRFYFSQDLAKAKASDKVKDAETKKELVAKLDGLVKALTTEQKIPQALEVRKVKEDFLAGNLDIATGAEPEIPESATPPKTEPAETTGKNKEWGWTIIKTDNLDDWSDPGKWWKTEMGMFVAESNGGQSLPKIHYLEWKGSTPEDLELSMEYRIITTSPQDAGVNIRVERPHANDLDNLPSLQAELDTGYLYGNNSSIKQGKLFGHIHDGKRSHMFKRALISTVHPKGKITTEPLPGGFDPRKAFKKPPEWNKCRILAVGPHVQLFLNGVLANEIYDHDPKGRSNGEGIALQYRPNGGYRFEVRNLKFRAATKAAKSVMSHASPGVEASAIDLALAGDYSGAARSLETEFAANPAAFDTMGGLSLAALYSATGEKEKHRQFCERFFERYSEWKIPSDASRPAQAYSLFPGADDPELLKKAEAAALHAVKNSRGEMRVWYELTLAMAQYRKGDFARAENSLSKPLKSNNPAQKIPARVFAAMIAYKQGKMQNAQNLLGAAEGQFKNADRSKLNWNDVVGVQVAINEAKTLIRR